VRDGSAPGGFVRGGPGCRRRGVGRLTGRQGPKTTRGGHRWRSEAAEGSVGMLSIPSDSKRLTSARDGSAPCGFVRGGPGCRRRGWEGSPAVCVPRRPEAASGGDPRRQRSPSGCYRYPLIVNGSPWRAMGRPRVAFTRGGSGWPAAGGGKAHRPSVSQDDPRRLQVEI